MMFDIPYEYRGAMGGFFMGFVVFGSVFIHAVIHTERGSEERRWAGGLFLLNLMGFLLFVYVFVLDFPGLR